MNTRSPLLIQKVHVHVRIRTRTLIRFYKCVSVVNKTIIMTTKGKKTITVLLALP